MKLFWHGKNPTYFSAYKITLKPGENTVADDAGAELLACHADACKRGKVEPKITKVEEKAAAKSSANAAKSILGVGGKGKDKSSSASSKGEK